MTQIHTLFDPGKDIYRKIEKVITYGTFQEDFLKAEISEYQVTENIEEHYFNLLRLMRLGMEEGGTNDVGVWVSGFYGSGKSSFTKYLGLAFDDAVTIDGEPFQTHLRNRFSSQQTKALLNTVTSRFPASVVMLDLASEMLAGAAMEDVSTVLFYKMLKFAGYSQNLKIAALERRLRKENRYEEFLNRLRDTFQVDWPDVRNDPLAADAIVPELAHQLYPEIFQTPAAFSTETGEFFQFENDRVEEMLDIVRDYTGKEYTLFVVDEMGQYVKDRPHLIQNLDGLAKNIKNIGGGKAWLIATAQQTLTEDSPHAALNAPELYKLKDRFPIRIDLESRDIKEICYKRLLGKSAEGAGTLADLFSRHGQALRHNTRLRNAKAFDSELNEKTFVHFYPFLPAHFEILLHLLSAFSKSTGGVGLRSAIKIVQDILVEGGRGRKPLAEQPVGGLVTAVTLYEALEKEIQFAFPSLEKTLETVRVEFPGQSIHRNVARTVVLLQILGNMPVTPHNVASLLHPGVEENSRLDAVETAVQEMIDHARVPFGEQDGDLRFFSERLGEIERERAELPLRGMETRRIMNDAVAEAMTPPPATRLDGSLTVTSGVKSRLGGVLAALSGDREAIQTVVVLAEAVQLSDALSKLAEESRDSAFQQTVFLAAEKGRDAEQRVNEIFRCQEICNRHDKEPDREIKEYCTAQGDRAARLKSQLRNDIRAALEKGAYIFRGQTTAVNSLAADLVEAGRRQMAEVAPQIFHRYAEAPVRAKTNLAEKFLRLENLRAATSQLDPLGLVQGKSGAYSIHGEHRALRSIFDYLDRNGAVDGKDLIRHFTQPPFGWSPDTLRYLVAAMLMAGEIKLKVSGKQVTVNGQSAIEALKSNVAFRSVGVSLREEKPSMEMLAWAAERLTALIGDMVMPLEDEISKAAAKHLPQFQSRFAPLGEKLTGLSLPGADRVDSLRTGIADLLFTDASEAPQRFGGEKSALYENLTWAGEVDAAFSKGLENTIRELRRHIDAIAEMSEAGAPGRLRKVLAAEIQRVEERLSAEDFHQHGPDLDTALTEIKARVRDTAEALAREQANTLRIHGETLSRLPEWSELKDDEKARVRAGLDELKSEVEPDLDGLKRRITLEFTIQQTVKEWHKWIVETGQKRKREREEQGGNVGQNPRYQAALRLPAALRSKAELAELIRKLTELRQNADLYAGIDVTLSIEE